MAYFRLRGCICSNKKRCKCGAKWSFTVDVGIDPQTGKRKQKTVSGFASQAEAQIACKELEVDLHRGDITVKENRTLADFTKYCLNNILLHKLSPSTMIVRWNIFRNHIEPSAAGKKLIHKLSADDLQLFYNNLSEIGLAPATISNVSQLIGQVLRLAIERDYIIKNINSMTTRPVQKKRKIEVWNKEQMERFLTMSAESALYPYYLIALNTGMRPGEILSTSWDLVDFSKMTVNVQRSLTRNSDNAVVLGDSPKNPSSLRTITLPAHVVAYLKRYKLEQFPNEYNLVVPGLNTPIMNQSTAIQIFKRDCKNAEVPFIYLHGLRHTHATYLLTPQPEGLGISVKAVSERLGHANTTTTLNTYFSVMPNMQDMIAERLDINPHKPVDKSAK